jgi:alpha-galactosidase
MGAHVSAVPNHQVGRITGIDTRANVAYFGAFGYELDVTKMTTEEKDKVQQQIAYYKENRKLLQTGTFYRIHSPFEKEGNVTGWMVVSDDQKEAIAGRYQLLGKPNAGYERLLLKGLNEELEYEIEGITGTFYGDELMNAGIQLDQTVSGSLQWGDFSSQIFRLKSLS